MNSRRKAARSFSSYRDAVLLWLLLCRKLPVLHCWTATRPTNINGAFRIGPINQNLLRLQLNRLCRQNSYSRQNKSLRWIRNFDSFSSSRRLASGNLNIEIDKENEEYYDFMDEDAHEDADEDANVLPSASPVQLPVDFGDDDSFTLTLTVQELQRFTVSQLKQQLRLRNLKVSGRKEELFHRLWKATSGGHACDVQPPPKRSTYLHKDAKPIEFTPAEESFLEGRDRGSQTKVVNIGRPRTLMDEESSSAVEAPAQSGVEVWGVDARIVDDFEGRQVVIDSLSRTRIEYTGSNHSTVQAYCVASRDALKPFLAGTGIKTNHTSAAWSSISPVEERLMAIQKKREEVNRRPLSLDDDAGLDEGDETGIFKNILNRDFSDWGKYTPTGAQMSSSEVQGVLLLTDVYGPFTEDTQALADKIAFECQPVVVLVPDLFAGSPWTAPFSADQHESHNYELWRSRHCHELRVSVDIRAAAACLRERYGCSSIVVWGMCFGGGRALEIASGWIPDDGNIHDVDGSVGPPPVNPMAAIAWYPTRYNSRDLFGPSRRIIHNNGDNGAHQPVAIMAVFAANDVMPGATREDAKVLKSLIEQDDRVIDHMVKVFPNQDHGFAHIGLKQQQNENQDIDPHSRFVDDEFGGTGRISFASSDSEVACLLSTAFMETYSRVFLPTVGPLISEGGFESEWGSTIDAESLDVSSNRDVRQEIRNALDNFVEEPLLSGPRIDPTDPTQEEELRKLLASMQDPSAVATTNEIFPEDDLPTVYAKLIAQDDQFQLF